MAKFIAVYSLFDFEEKYILRIFLLPKLPPPSLPTPLYNYPDGIFDCLKKNYASQLCLLLSTTALVPGQVQNLRSTLNPKIPSLTLNWDKPSNVKTAEEVTAYDIRFRPAASWWRKGYYKMTVDSPATSVLITRENGLNPLTTYDFEVRARNAGLHEGEWSKVSKYIGMYIPSLTNSVLLMVEVYILGNKYNNPVTL